MRDTRIPVRLRSTQDVILAVPHILGFHPSNSLVLLDIASQHGITAVRVDLPAARHRRQVAEDVVNSLPNLTAAMLVVFDDGPTDPAADPPPHAGLVDVVTTALRRRGTRDVLAVWAQSAHLGARWHSYTDPALGGTLPDHKYTELAAANAVVGHVTFASREELAAQLAPVDDEILARRQILLDQTTIGQGIPRDARAAVLLVFDTITASRKRGGPLDDDQVVQVAQALSDPEVRDACFTFALGRLADEAERLWLELTRGCPASVRANPATLLAFSACVRGNEALASIALDHALTADPGHRLGGLLRTALDTGMPNDQLVEIIKGLAITEARLLFEAGTKGAFG